MLIILAMISALWKSPVVHNLCFTQLYAPFQEIDSNESRLESIEQESRRQKLLQEMQVLYEFAHSNPGCTAFGVPYNAYVPYD